MILQFVEFIARLRGKPRDAPKRLPPNSAAWQRAAMDLRRAVDSHAWWESLPPDRGNGVNAARLKLEGIFSAREQQIDALWRLGWDDRARHEQRTLDADRGWWTAR